MLPNARMRKKNGNQSRPKRPSLQMSGQRYKLSFEKTDYCLFNSENPDFRSLIPNVNFAKMKIAV